MSKNNVQTMGGLPTVMNAMRLESSSNYQEMVPELNDQNFKEFASGILNNQELANEWAQNLINRIGLVVVKKKSWNNPMAFLKKGMLEYGDTVEEIYTDILQEKIYNPTTDELTAGEVYASAVPDIYAVFHKINREGKFETSISRKMLQRAFASPRALEKTIDDIINNLTKSDNLAEFEYMKKALEVYQERGLFYEVKVDKPVDTLTTNALIEQVKKYAKNFTFLSRKYNAFGVMNHADLEEQVIFISTELSAKIDVQSLANAFNLDKIEFLPRQIVLDEMPGGKDTHLILASKEMFMFHDVLFTTTDNFNPNTLENKFWLHHHQVLSTSRFENAVLFTSRDVSEPSTIELTNSTVDDKTSLGHSVKFSALVKDTDGESEKVNQAVLYYITGNESPNTKIDENGFLKIDLNETSKSVKIMVRSLHYPNVTAESTLTIE